MTKRRTKVQIVVDNLEVEFNKRDCSIEFLEEEEKITITNDNAQTVQVKIKTVMNMINQLNEMHGLHGIDEVVSMVMQTFKLND